MPDCENLFQNTLKMLVNKSVGRSFSMFFPFPYSSCVAIFLHIFRLFQVVYEGSHFIMFLRIAGDVFNVKNHDLIIYYCLKQSIFA